MICPSRSQPCPETHVPAGDVRALSPEALRTAARAIRRAAPSNPPLPPELELLPLAPMSFRVRWRAARATAPEAETPLVLRTVVTEAAEVVRAQFDTVLETAAGERRISIRHDRAAVEIQLGWLRPNGALLQLARTGPMAAIPAAMQRPLPEPAADEALCGPVLSSPRARPAPTGGDVPAAQALASSLAGDSGAGAPGADAGWPLALRAPVPGNAPG